MDGEDSPAERAEADRHLAGCEMCRDWFQDAASVTRMVRMSAVAGSPGVSDEVLAALPGAGRRRLAMTLRLALMALGLSQLLLGLTQISSGSQGHDHTGAAVTSSHLWHESAAWNVAIGAGFLWIGLRKSRPAGLVPLLTAFVAVLMLLSVNDLLVGRVDPSRLLSHALVLAGYVIMLILGRRDLDSGEPPANRDSQRGRWRVQFDRLDEETGVVAPLRLVVPLVPPQTARRDHAA